MDKLTTEPEPEQEPEGRRAPIQRPLHRRTDFARLPDPDADARRSIAGARVLLVDDTPDTLETFAYLLESEGAVVSTALSGQLALALAESKAFDLIVSDVGMPVMDGYELIAELRRRPGTAAVPAIALTGYGRPQDVQQAVAAGFQAHVDKPVDFAHMRELMQTLLAGAPMATTPSNQRPKE